MKSSNPEERVVNNLIDLFDFAATNLSECTPIANHGARNTKQNIIKLGSEGDSVPYIHAYANHDSYFRHCRLAAENFFTRQKFYPTQLPLH